MIRNRVKAFPDRKYCVEEGICVKLGVNGQRVLG